MPAVVTINADFTSELQVLQQHLREAAPQDWFLPKALKESSGYTHTDPETWKIPRQFVDDMFLQALSDQPAGAQGDPALASIQSDTLATIERAYRARHGAGVLRTEVWSNLGQEAAAAALQYCVQEYATRTQANSLEGS